MTGDRRLTRRAALTQLGVVSAGALLAACGDGDGGSATVVTTTAGAQATVEPKTASSESLASRLDAAANCEQTAELTEGPYYLDVDRIRSDIREDRRGTPLRVAVRVRDAESCQPIADAAVDVWHCDAAGLYSGFEAASTGGPGGGGPTDAKTYLRGTQVTNADGIVQFRTIYPGWYRGRTVHIHAKVILDKTTALTTQLFFADDTTAKVYEHEPYASHTGRDTFNDSDGIYQPQLELTLSQEDGGWLGLMTFDVRRV